MTSTPHKPSAKSIKTAHTLSSAALLGALFTVSAAALSPQSATGQASSAESANTQTTSKTDNTQPSNSPITDAWQAQADHVLEHAENATDAVWTWMNNRTDDAAQHMRDAEQLTRDAWDNLLTDARTAHEAGLGLQVYAHTQTAQDQIAQDQTEFVQQDIFIPFAELETRSHAAAQLPDRVVVLVHGLDEPGDIWSELAPALFDAGHTTLRFNYANDQHPADSAEDLADALVELGTKGVTHVDLVGHSMGGLIARDIATSPDPVTAPTIASVITVGTPSGGAPLAKLRGLGEVREHVARWLENDSRDVATLAAFLVDGSGEAGQALLPQSDYLTQLNARPWPNDLPLLVIAGRWGDQQAEAATELVSQTWVQRALGAAGVQRVQQEIDQLTDTAGDGVVSLDSALAYVPNQQGVRSEILAANHRTLIKSIDWLGTEAPATQLIIDQLDHVK